MNDMYGHELGATTSIGTGAMILPNTGGNPILTAAAIVLIGIGSVVLLSTIVRAVVKRAYKA